MFNDSFCKDTTFPAILQAIWQKNVVLKVGGTTMHYGGQKHTKKRLRCGGTASFSWSGGAADGFPAETFPPDH
jgi:hypothetical protein